VSRRTDFRTRLAAFINRDFKDLRTQLVVDMTSMESLLGTPNATDFANAFDIPRNRVTKFEKDTWVDISRKHLQKLLQLEARIRVTKPAFSLFTLRRDPIWETFESTGIGFVGQDLDGVTVEVDHYVLGAFSTAGLSLIPPPAGLSVTDAMRMRNCVFVGSPKCNEATEIALNALFESGDPPLVFSWPNWPPGRQPTRISREGQLGVHYIDHHDEVAHILDKSPSRPVGALVVCRSPLGTDEPVTTIIAVGSSRFGTVQVVEDLLGGGVHVPSSQLTPSQPAVLLLMPRGGGERWYNVAGSRELAIKKTARRADATGGSLVANSGAAGHDQALNPSPPKSASETKKRGSQIHRRKRRPAGRRSGLKGH
jgi:hypothetical protein